MSETPWRDGDDRRRPQRSRPGAYPGPDPGADDRDRALYLDGRDAYQDGRGAYRDDGGAYRDDGGAYQDGRGAYGDDGGAYQDDGGAYRDDGGAYQDGRGAYRDDGGAYGDDDAAYRDLYRPASGASRAPRRWGTLPGSTGVLIVIASAALGALITAVTSSQPGLVLGVLVVAGTITAALAVRPRAAYLVIPVPALAYVVAASLAGLISDRATGTSITALAVNGTQWIASGFIAMTVATGLAIVITLVRWYISRRAQRPSRPSRSRPKDTGHGQRGPRHGPGAAGGTRMPPGSRSVQRRP
jgi:hypothetical protein